MLRVRDITVAFDGRVVLDRIGLDVERGETVALLGPSGSGKSTLLRVIAGLLRADSGSVVVGDIDVSGVPTHERSVGMVFQDEQLFPHLDVGRNIEFGLKMTGVPVGDRRARVEELLELVGLSGFERRSVERLSGGEAKRVALARSLAPAPDVLLLDEPLTGLDRDLRMRLAVDIAAILARTDTTALWVTHDDDEAALVAARVVRLDER